MYTSPQSAHDPQTFKEFLLKRASERHGLIKEHPILIREDSDLFHEQKEFINDKHRFKTAVCSRRAGKTSAIARKLRKIVSQGWEHNALYVARTTEQCKRVMWTMLLQVLAKYHRPNEYKTNASELSIYFKATNSFIWLKGASDSTQIHKLLGVKLKYVCIDEAQSFPAFLEYLVEQILGPALSDLQGQLDLTGTPNPTCSGYFYDACHKETWAHHHWTIAHNTFFLTSAMKENKQITSIDDVINYEADRRGVPITDAVIQRDYFGRWVKSTELQVYKYDAAKQDFLTFPDVSMEVVVGIDLGFDDADAVVAVGFQKGQKVCWLLEEYKSSKNDITSLAIVIKRFVAKWSPYCCVIDAGALGKKIASELSIRHELTLTAAEKERKSEFIEILNDDMRNGRVRIKANSRLAQEMGMLCWDQDYFDTNKFVENADFDNHLCDAFLYSYRWAYHYIYKNEVIEELTYEQKDELNFLEKLKKDKEAQEGFVW